VIAGLVRRVCRRNDLSLHFDRCGAPSDRLIERVMTLAFLFALMTAAAVFAVLWPLRAQRKPPRAGSDIAVYRDQLEEIARDRAAGLIGTAEAEAARVEISRRLLAADAAVTAAPAAGATLRRRAVAVAALVGLPALAAALYLALGSPQLPGQPLAERTSMPVEQRPVDTLVAQVEGHLEKNPEDGRGWEVLAPVYLRIGRFEDAVKARRNALRLLGATADREADIGEALTASANGVVTAEATGAFERALARDAKNVKARFFFGLAAEQDGDRAAAAQYWRDIIKEAPPGAPWIAVVREALARVDTVATSGPSREDVQAAERMAPEDRQAMIHGMVERLAERLKREGGNVEDWLRLVRAYVVLGDRDKARAAAADGRRALGSDAGNLRRLDELVKGLGLEG
jgi:cytochrome c-type biogenesis protein CcmH